MGRRPGVEPERAGCATIVGVSDDDQHPDDPLEPRDSEADDSVDEDVPVDGVDEAVEDDPVAVDDEPVDVEDEPVDVDEDVVEIEDEPVEIEDELVGLDDEPVLVDENPDDAERDDEPVDDEPGDDEHEPTDADEADDLPTWFAPTNGPEAEESGPSPTRRRVRRALIAVGLVLGALYLLGFVMTGLRMPANASIGGVEVGGKSPDAARAAVDDALSPRIDDDVVLEHEGKKFAVAPKSAGLAFDLDRTIDEAGGQHSWNPARMLGLVFGTHDTDPAVDADDAKLRDIVTSIAAGIDQDVVEPQITFPKAKPKARKPKAGLVVRKGDAAQAVIDGYLVARGPIAVPTAVVDPTVDSDGLDEAMATIAEPAVSGPVTIKVGKKKVKLPVSAYAPALVVRVIDDALKPEIDPEKLAKPLTNSTTGIGKKAVDATVRIRNGKAVVIPGKAGLGLQPEEMAVKLVPAITETGDDRSVEIDAKVVEPEFTTKDAKKLKIKERVSSFSTYFPYAPYRNINQGRAAELIDGTILEPGETFSFNDTVGERTVANGFTTGTVINGGVFREELGGGVSQVATTTYNAAFFAGLDDIEHHPHAFYLDRYPVGREATIYFGNLDLRFRNSTKYGVLIRAYVNKSTPGAQGEMHVEMWSTKVWDVKAGLSPRRNPRTPGKQYDDTDRCVPQGPIPGFDIDVYRTFIRNGKVVKRETDTARYQAADHVICGKKP